MQKLLQSDEVILGNCGMLIYAFLHIYTRFF